MPPKFERKLAEKNIPFEQRGDYTIVFTNPVPGGYENATEFTNTLLGFAKETDARHITGEGDHIEFGPQ